MVGEAAPRDTEIPGPVWMALASYTKVEARLDLRDARRAETLALGKILREPAQDAPGSGRPNTNPLGALPRGPGRMPAAAQPRASGPPFADGPRHWTIV